MYFDGALVDVAAGVDVLVIVLPGKLAVHQFDATDLDDAVALGGLQAGGFGVQYDLSHNSSMPLLAS